MLTFVKHVNDIARACNFHKRALHYIHRFIHRDVANTIACSIISACIDYCNSLLYCTNEGVLDKLQWVQNRLARTVCNYSVCDHHVIDVLRELHWLSVRSRITFKVAMLCFKAHQLSEPAYLKSLIHPYVPARTFRSSDQGLLKLPASKTKMASCQFSSAAPSVHACMYKNASLFPISLCTGSASVSLLVVCPRTGVGTCVRKSASLFRCLYLSKSLVYTISFHSPSTGSY